MGVAMSPQGGKQTLNGAHLKVRFSAMSERPVLAQVGPTPRLYSLALWLDAGWGGVCFSSAGSDPSLFNWLLVDRHETTTSQATNAITPSACSQRGISGHSQAETNQNRSHAVTKAIH